MKNKTLPMSHDKTPAFLCCCLFTDIIAEYVFGGKREMGMGVGRGTRMGEVLASVGGREEAGGDTAAGQVRSKGLRIG